MIHYFRTDEPTIAQALSFGKWKGILIGSKFDRLSRTEQAAVLMHEEGHCNLHHTEWRILCLLFAPFLFFWLCRRQEFEADKYAALRGHAQTLSRFLASEYDGGWFQPSHKARRKALKQYEHLRMIPVKDHSLGSA